MANKDELIQEAIDAIVNFDAAAAEDVATRALAAGMAPARSSTRASSWASARSATPSSPARSFCPS